MNEIAKFKKVSLERFINDCQNNNLHIFDYKSFHDELKLPTRATTGSAGYDFKIPFDMTFAPHSTYLIPSGIRVKMNEGWVLMCFPRSGLGFKYRMQLDNTCGVIDSDYYYSDNEGHIMFKITNHSDSTIKLSQGDSFVQGIFVQFGITVDDNATEKRNGGFGSTSEKHDNKFVNNKNVSTEISKDLEQYWVFTFGKGHENEGHYVIIYGTFDKAREKMSRLYDNKWEYQYSKLEWDRLAAAGEVHGTNLYPLHVLFV